MQAALPDQPAHLRRLPARSRPVTAALPLAPTPIVGRQREIAHLLDLLRQPECRLITLTGPGGVGKTRLAVAAATEVEREFADGCRYVCLAPLAHSIQVLPELARGLDVQEVRGRSLLDGVKAALRDKELLLVVNNFEHVAAAAPLLTTILANAPGVTLLVTSRTLLHLRDEHEFPVEPLNVPATGLLALGKSEWRGSAIELFVERARDSSPQFELTAEALADIGEICDRLDGLPLAIELAAARIKVLPPQAMRSRLDHRLPLLVAGPHDLPVHQQTMRNTIRWSHDLLHPVAQTIFRRLAAFTSSAELDTIVAVCDWDGTVDADLERGLASLAEHQLITKVDESEDGPRFAMLETIREFGLEQLIESGEENEIREAHAIAFCDLAEKANALLRGAGLGHWLERLERDHPNLRASLSWWIERGDAARALLMVTSLNRFWEAHAHLREGREWTTRALALDAPATEAARGFAYAGNGFLAYRLGSYELAEREATQGLEIGQAFDHKRAIGLAYDTLGGVAYARGDYRHATEMFQRSLAVYREIGDSSEIAILLNDVGVAARESEDYDTARRIHLEALELARESGDPRALAFVLVGLGVVAQRTGALDEAIAYHEESLALQREFDHRSAPKSICYLGASHFLKGDLEHSAALYREGLQLHWERGDQNGIAEAIGGFIRIAAALDRSEQAVRLFGAVEALREAIGASMTSPDHRWCQQTASEVAAKLGQSTFEALYAEGRRWHVETAVREAFAVGASFDVATPEAGAQPNELGIALTGRELEVLSLLADGQSDKEIADRLYISHRTVMKHVSSILTKCGVPSRTAAVAFAIRNNLL